MKAGYRRWLEEQKYDAGTINAQMYRATRVEEHHGNLDDHWANDRMASLIDSLRYSTDDRRHSRPNPSKIPFEGDIRNNLASYRNAVERYRKFPDVAGDLADATDRGEGASALRPTALPKKLVNELVLSAICKRR